MNAKMKILSLALVGLCGYAGSAMACPAGPTIAEGGAWTAKFVGGGVSALSIQPGGYDASACKLQVSLGNNGGAQAQVMDDTPANETHYRAQFIFDAANLSGANGGSQAVIALANAGAAHNSILNMVKVSFAGSGGGSTTAGKKLFIRTACETSGTCGSAGLAIPNQTGPNRIEFDLVVGANGTATFRYWLNDAATTGLSDATPTGSIVVAGGNIGWAGVDKALLGLASPTIAYRGVNTGLNAWFDQFDSRRNTFIGH